MRRQVKKELTGGRRGKKTAEGRREKTEQAGDRAAE